MWGFAAISGRSAGGGLFTKVTLDANETIDDTVPATFRGGSWIDQHGYLTLTTRRFIYTPNRWPLSLLASRPTVFDYGAIKAARTQLRREPDKPDSFLVPALIIELVQGKEKCFWPAADPESLADAINSRLRA